MLWMAARAKSSPSQNFEVFSLTGLLRKLLYYIGVYIGIVEKKMETTILYRGVYWDSGKENGNNYIIII